MINCPNCGAENADGTSFCARCGAQLAASAAPSPESWRTDSDTQNRAPSDFDAPAGGASGSYTPPPQQSSYPVYNQPAGSGQYGQSNYGQANHGAPAGNDMHPAIPAIISLLVPGIGLLFVPNKAGLGLAIFAATIGFYILATVLTFFVVGICLFLVAPLINVAAAVHSFDEAAKASGGRYQPVLFKG